MKHPRTLGPSARLPMAAGAVMLWVAVSPWLWGFAGSRSAVANHVFLAFAFGPLALLVVALRAAALVTLAGGVWLVISPWVLGYATVHAAWASELVTGLLLVGVCLKAAGADPLRFVPVRRRKRTASRRAMSAGSVPSES